MSEDIQHEAIRKQVGQLSDEVSILKTGFATLAQIQQSMLEDVRGVKVDVKTVSVSMSEGFASLSKEMGAGLREVSNQKPKLGFDFLFPFVGMLATGIVALWVVINLLVAPIEKDLAFQIQKTDPLITAVVKQQVQIENLREQLKERADAIQK